MADIIPFYCVHPAAEYASRVAALPYDVYSRKEAYLEAAKDRLSFLNIDRPETQFPESADMFAPEVYQKARRLLETEIADGIFVQDRESRAYYIYELTAGEHSQTGLVACASIDDYLRNVIKKHENTRAAMEEDRVRHVDVCSAQTGPIFLAYRRNVQLREITDKWKLEEPMFDFVSSDGIRHRGWRISSDSDNRRIQTAFKEIDRIYIADGHHRAASAVRVGMNRRAEHPGYCGNEEFNYFLAVLFPDDELNIVDYNRVVKDLNGMNTDEFLARVAEKFEIHSCETREKPQQKGTVTMYLEGRWYRLQIRDAYKSADAVDGLDVAILQRELLAPILGIGDPKQDTRIDFVGGIRGLEELERRVHTDCAVAFAMYPTSIAELFAVADENRLMPPKSTWFEPKLRSGLFIHQIER